MIRYALTCANRHDFESWFASAEAFDALAGAGHLSCPDCGSAEVKKALMAPGVSTRKEGPPDLRAPATDRERALAELRRKVEENADYVGLNFATEARAIHEGDAPARSIWGEAALEDAKALLEDGVPVAPLPGLPRSKTN